MPLELTITRYLTLYLSMEPIMSLPPRKRSFQHGQGMLEYALIVFLIASVAILGIVFLVPVILNALGGSLPAL
jgi:Flp pilus assembly pilin Flp